MDKEKGLKLQFTFAAIFLGLLLIALLYAIMNYPGMWIAIVAFGILTLADIFWIVFSVLGMISIRDAKRVEQYESIFKSEKASYLMLKKYSEEITERLKKLESIVSAPTTEIINAQKSIAKVIISRERENAEAIMNANDILTEQLEALEKKMENNNLAAEAKYEEAVNAQKEAILSKQQDLVVALKDMELRLTSALNQRPVMATMAAPAAMPQMVAPASVPAPVAEPIADEIMIDEPAFDDIMIDEPALDDIMIDEPVADDPIIEEPIAEEPVIDEPVIEEPIAEEPVIDEPVIEEPIAEEPVAEEPAIEEAPVIAAPSDDPNHKMTDEEIAALIAGTATPAEEPAVEEPVAEEPAVEEAPVIAAPSDDPNHKMTDEEIAALIAGTAAPAEEPVVEEPVAEEPVIEEPVAEEPAPAPVSEDPNKMMSPDDIAALISSMGAEAAPVVEEAPAEEPKPDMPDLSDPNKKMSPDEIAALFANMG